jgi:hypothetical protein
MLICVRANRRVLVSSNHDRFDEIGLHKRPFELRRLCVQASGNDIKHVATIPQGDAAQLCKVLEDN